jgi:hypothetical protein
MPLRIQGVEMGHLGMWKEEKLYDSAVLLLEGLHCMTSCRILPVRPQALEQVLERVMNWVLLNVRSVSQSYHWNISQNCLPVAIVLAMIVISSMYGLRYQSLESA